MKFKALALSLVVVSSMAVAVDESINNETGQTVVTTAPADTTENSAELNSAVEEVATQDATAE